MNERRRYKAGDISSDRPALVFLRYRPNGKEYWASPEQHEREKRYARETRKALYHSDPAFKQKALAATAQWCKKPGSQERKQKLYKGWIGTERGRKLKRAGQAKHLATIQGTLKNRLRSRLAHALRKRGAKRADRTFSLIGCSPHAFQVHFESLFTEGMSWDKFLAGEVEIDHKLPMALFDLTDPDQQRAVCYFENLQPMWSKDNKSKNDFVNGVRARDLRKQNIIPFVQAA